MQIKKLWIFIILLVLLPSISKAEPFNGFWKSRQLRQKQAQDWHAGFAKINEQIPTLSPAEERWLRTEYDNEIGKEGKFTNRAFNAMESKEYDIRITKTRINNILRVLSVLSEKNILDQKSEVILWINLSSLYMDNQLWQSINGLIKHKVLDESVSINGVNKYYHQTYVLWAQYILDNIVLTYINGNLGK
jgi:hypothetical protein